MACEDPEGGQDWETYFEEGDEQCSELNAVEGQLETQGYAHSRPDKEH